MSRYYGDTYYEVNDYYDSVLENLTSIRTYLTHDLFQWVQYQSCLLMMCFFAMMMISMWFMFKVGRR